MDKTVGIDRNYINNGYLSSGSDHSSDISSTEGETEDNFDSGLSPSSSDSEASGAPIRDATKKLFKLLYQYCKSSDLNGVKQLLPEVDQLRRSLNSTNLLNQPNLNDRYQRTPLLASIEGGNLELVQTLLMHGADPKRETIAPDSCNSINLAFRYGHTSIAEFLLDHGYFSIEHTDHLFQFSLLHQAAYGHVDCVKMLINRGANVNATSSFQVTPLHAAVSSGNSQVVEELVMHGANADARDKFGRTPLFLACNSLNLPIVKILVEKGNCDVNITDNNNNSAFDIADKKNIRETCRYLLSHGAIPKSIKENASGMGNLRFFRPYIQCGQGLPHELPTARVKSSMFAIGTKIYLSGGQGLKTVQNRPDESIFKNAELLYDFFMMDIKDIRMEYMVSHQHVQEMLAWASHPNQSKNEINDLVLVENEDKLSTLMLDESNNMNSPQKSLNKSNNNLNMNMSNMSNNMNNNMNNNNINISNTPNLNNLNIINNTVSSPRKNLQSSSSHHQPASSDPVALVLSKTRKSDRIKVSKDGLTATAMPPHWKPGMSSKDLSTTTARGSMVSYQSEPHFIACVQSTEPYTRRLPIAYWEVQVLEATEKVMTLGFTHDDFPMNRYHPGWCLDSYAYHNDDGSCFHVQSPIPENGQPWGPRFSTGDVVGAGINFITNEVFFTKNGKFLGIAYRGVSGDAFYATLSFGSSGCKAKVNMGRKPFKFNFLVPTLSWTRLGTTKYSPLALIPHPKQQNKFIQIAFGVEDQEALLIQRGDRFEEPYVSIISVAHINQSASSSPRTYKESFIVDIERKPTHILTEKHVKCQFSKHPPHFAKHHVEQHTNEENYSESSDESVSSSEDEAGYGGSSDEDEDFGRRRQTRNNPSIHPRHPRTNERLRRDYRTERYYDGTKFLLPESEYKVHFDSKSCYLFSCSEDSNQPPHLFCLSFQSTSTSSQSEEHRDESNNGDELVFVWSDILRSVPHLKRELSMLKTPGSALIDDKFYVFNESTLIILDLILMKFEKKSLTGIGPRGGNFTSTVIRQGFTASNASNSTTSSNTINQVSLESVTNQILCFGGVAGNILQSNVHILELDECEWDVPHLSGVYPRPRDEQGGIVYVGEDQHMVVIHGGWNGKNYIDDLDFLHLEDPVAPDPLVNAINNQMLCDCKISKRIFNLIGENETDSKTEDFVLVNKIILACRSTYFKQLFELNPNLEVFPLNQEDCQRLSIQLPMQKTTNFVTNSSLNQSEFWPLFKTFIKYLYTDTIESDIIDDTNASMFIELFKVYAPDHRERVVEELVLTRPGLKSSMNSDLALAFNSELFHDIKFLVTQKTGDAPVVFFGHRAILCTRNEYFKAMFLNTHFKEAQNREAHIKQVHPSVFSELLRYIYTFDINLDAVQDLIVDLLQVSHRFGVKGLQTLTSEIIASNLTIDNVVSLLALGEQLAIRKLVKSAISFIKSNYEDVSKTEDFVAHHALIESLIPST